MFKFENNRKSSQAKSATDLTQTVLTAIKMTKKKNLENIFNFIDKGLYFYHTKCSSKESFKNRSFHCGAVG